jgi:hypothetical protein
MTQAHHAAVVLLCLALAGCAGAPEEPAAVVPTQLPTLPPFSSTSAQLPGAVSSGEELGLGPEFIWICRCDLAKNFPPDLEYAAGIKELRTAEHPAGLIPWFRFPGNGSFTFASVDNTQFVHGASVVLKDLERQDQFDAVFVADFPAAWKLGMLELTPDVVEIMDVSVGDASVGVTANPMIDGFAWRLTAVSFRIGGVGAFVFTLHPSEVDGPGDIVEIAQMYADSMGD